MDCQKIEREDVIEKYLTHRLSSGEQQAFEEHYFECAKCFEALQTLRAAKAELEAGQGTIRAEAPARGPSRRWLWTAGFAAAAVIAAIIFWPLPPAQEPPAPGTVPPVATQPRPVPPPSLPSLEELAQFEPPSYTPVVLRGSVDEATRKFREAMESYRKADYAQAIVGLREAAKLNPTDAGTLFFQGVSCLLAGQTDDGIAVLQRTVALGDTPYLEEALFYLAKAFLQKSNLNDASEQLKKVIALRGDLGKRAEELLAQVDALRTQRR